MMMEHHLQALVFIIYFVFTILVLHDVEGLSHEECASILECRVGTCKSQLHKARARMRDLLGPIGDRK